MTKTFVTLVAAALLVPPLAALGLVGVISYQDASDEADPPDLGALLAPSADVSVALADEMTWQVVRIVGLDDALPDAPGPDSVRRTDEAIAAARAASGSDWAEALAAATDGLDGLDAVRADAEAIAGSTTADLTQAAAAETVLASYLALDGVFALQVSEAILGFDDPDLRRAAQLMDTAHELGHDSVILRRDLLLAAVDSTGGVNDPDEIAELAAAISSVQQLVAELRAAPAPYDTAVTAADLESVDELTAQAEVVLATGTIDVTTVVAGPADPWFAALADQINATYDEQVADDGGNDRAVAAALTVAGGLGAVLAMAAVVLLALRLSNGPTSDTSGGEPPLPPTPVHAGGQGTSSATPPPVPSPPAGSA